MHHRKSTFSIMLVFLILGLLIGSVLGELLAWILPDGSVVEMFLTHSLIHPQLGPATVDLVVLSFTLGLSLKLNIISVLGVVFSAVLLRRYLFFYQ